ncbi:Alcohol dehydrogenase GroES-like domain, partial [Teratosphaeria destructans]
AVINGSKLGAQSLVDAIRAAADNGVGPTVTVETTGAPALIRAGFEATRNRGRYVQVGTAPFDFRLDISMFEFMVAGKQLFGAVEGQAYPRDYVPKMIQWYREGRFPIEKMMKFMPAEEFETALQEMHDGVTIKPILLWRSLD